MSQQILLELVIRGNIRLCITLRSLLKLHKRIKQLGGKRISMRAANRLPK